MRIKNENKPIGIFYKIKDSHGITKGYIFGTTHANWGSHSEFGINEKVMACFRKANDLTVEYNVFNHPKLSSLGMQKEIIAKIKNMQSQGAQGQDVELLIQASERDLPIYDLETQEIQDKALDGYKKEYSKNVFSKYLKMPADESQATPEEAVWMKEFKEISELKDICFKISDETAVERIAKYGCSEEFYRGFNDERNVKMAEKCDQILRGEGRHFIATGAGHAVGGAGVPNLLKEKGWVVEKV